MKGILFTVLFLNLVYMNHVRGDCEINGIELANRTIFYRYPGNRANQLLMKSTVPIGTELILACADSKHDITVECKQSTSLIGMIGKEKCLRPLKVDIKEAVDSERMRNCSSPNIDYKIGYNYGNSFFELYRVCFNKTGKRTVFTYIKFQDFSDTYKILRPETSFTVDPISGYTGAEHAKLSINSVCETFNTLLGSGSPIVRGNRACVIARGHLVAQNDFFQSSNKKATFKLINTVPQFQAININNWKNIESWSHRAYSGQSTIITGAFGELELQNAQNSFTKMCLLPPNKMPIPTWMYKIVASKGQCTIFLTYNNIYTTAPALPCTARCPSDLKLTPGVTAGQTACCTNQEFKGLTNINHGIC